MVAALALVACGGDDRPSAADWADAWEREQALVPSADELSDGGQPLCDELIGELRGSLNRLTPTPTEALDDAVKAWADHADSLVFECPEGDRLAERHERLDVLAAEVDAGLAAGSG